AGAYTSAGVPRALPVRYERARDPPALQQASRATMGLEPPRRRRPVWLPSPGRALNRVPGYEEARTALWLAHNTDRAERAPGRALLNVSERLRPADIRAAAPAVRHAIDLARGR